MNSTSHRAARKAKEHTSSTAVSSDKPPRAGKRYAAEVERGAGAAVWRKEWSRFISNVDMSELGESVKLKRDADHAEASANSTFSYLFKTAKPADMKQKYGRDARAAPAVPDGPSRMSKLIKRAEGKGVELEGLNRKERRAAVRAEATDEQIVREEKLAKKAEAEKAAQESALPPRPKPHELMDKKLAWYQQGPSPLDIVSERLVLKKALKHARQNGWKYNYESPHPSWLASRARKRREANLTSEGTRIVFSTF
jgi:hypothetical protein